MEAKAQYKTQAMSVGGVPGTLSPPGSSLRDMAARVSELVHRAHTVLDGPERTVGESSAPVAVTVEEQLEYVGASLQDSIAGLEKLCERLTVLVGQF
jgi:hypothetical protein